MTKRALLQADQRALAALAREQGRVESSPKAPEQDERETQARARRSLVLSVKEYAAIREDLDDLARARRERALRNLAQRCGQATVLEALLKALGNTVLR